MKRTQKQLPDPQRRHFFRKMMAEVLSVCEEIGGRPQLKTDDISQLPDRLVRQIVPVPKPRQATKIVNDHLLLGNQDTQAFKPVCRLNPEEKQFILAMDGRSSLDQLARKMADNNSLTPSQAYERVKSAFCRLARLGVCAPLDAHQASNPTLQDPEGAKE